MSKNFDTTKYKAAQQAIKYAPRIAAEFGADAAASGATAGATTGAATGADVAGLAGMEAGSGGAQGLSGMSAGGYASLAAPLIMTYLAYTGGSHHNTPLRRRNEVGGIGRYLTDLFKGKEVTPESDYGLFTPYTEPIREGGPTRKLTPYETISQWLTNRLITPGGRDINSGVTPQQFYGYLQGQGVTGDWLKNTLGTDLSEWANPNFDLNGSLSKMQDLSRENARTAATNGNANARKVWFEQYEPYATPEEAGNQNFWDLTQNPGVENTMQQRLADPTWWKSEDELSPEERAFRDRNSRIGG